MTGVAIEQMLELWCVELRQVKADLHSLFAHPSVATSAAAFLDGLLAPSGARPAGYGRRPPATRVLGASRLCSGAATGTQVAGTAEQIAQELAPGAWKRLSAGDGTKGARLYDWAYLELADLAADEYNEALTGLWTRGLLIRRTISDGDLAFFSTWCPAGTPIEELVRVEGQRWAIEDAFETAKTELGLTHNETRSWHGWHRHVSLVMLAFAMMAVVRQRANNLSSPQKRSDEAKLQRWCDGLSRKSAAWPPASSSAGSSLPL